MEWRRGPQRKERLFPQKSSEDSGHTQAIASPLEEDTSSNEALVLPYHIHPRWPLFRLDGKRLDFVRDPVLKMLETSIGFLPQMGPSRVKRGSGAVVLIN